MVTAGQLILFGTCIILFPLFPHVAGLFTVAFFGGIGSGSFDAGVLVALLLYSYNVVLLSSKVRKKPIFSKYPSLIILIQIYHIGIQCPPSFNHREVTFDYKTNCCQQFYNHVILYSFVKTLVGTFTEFPSGFQKFEKQNPVPRRQKVL